MKKIIITFFFIIIVVGATGIANASSIFNGEQVLVQYLYPDITTIWNGNSTLENVGAGVEISGFPVGDPRTNIDISDLINNIYITYNSTDDWNDSSFNGIRFNDFFSSIEDFYSVTLNPATNMVGLSNSDITFDSNNIWLNWAGLPFDTRTIVSLDINTNPIPEPATMFLLGTGLVGVAGAARRKKKNQA